MAAIREEGWLAYCRPGFESECAQELGAQPAALDAGAYVKARPAEAYVRLIAGREIPDIAVGNLVFARQVLKLHGTVTATDPRDRLTPLFELVDALPAPFADLLVETPDSEPGAHLKALASSLETVAFAALRKRDRHRRDAQRRLHVLLVGDYEMLVGTGDLALASPLRDGIPRLRLGRDAPSRSALKIEEAWLTMLSDDERERWLKPGMTAVDLGAAPGGWTWQLAKRSLRVTAIDNGPLAPHVMEMPVVTHLREDGFRYRPKKPVDWLVCDMVEQPVRVASLMAGWLRERYCRFALFNLKLPMKKRYVEVQRCLHVLHEESGLSLDVRAKQLYHDREEITVFARVVSGKP